MEYPETPRRKKAIETFTRIQGREKSPYLEKISNIVKDYETEKNEEINGKKFDRIVRKCPVCEINYYGGHSLCGICQRVWNDKFEDKKNDYKRYYK